MIRIGISGVAGRMGNAIAGLVEKAEDLELALGLEKKGNNFIGSNICGCVVTDDLKAGAKGIDVFIDFSMPAATLANLSALSIYGTPTVIGTTGFKDNELAEIRTASAKLPIVLSSNYSVGVNVMWKLVREAVKVMKDYDIDIVESHHRMKKDAPSGTAVTTAKIIMDAKGLDYDKNIITGRSGRDNDRPRDQVGIFAVRGGGVVGEHTVIFADMGDKLEIKHTAFSRDTLAAGALTAARFVIGKKPGMYSMADVLKL